MHQVPADCPCTHQGWHQVQAESCLQAGSPSGLPRMYPNGQELILHEQGVPFHTGLSSLKKGPWSIPPALENLGKPHPLHVDPPHAVPAAWPRYRIVGTADSGQYNLEITDAELSDDAVYECQATEAALRSRRAKLTVLSKKPAPHCTLCPPLHPTSPEPSQAARLLAGTGKAVTACTAALPLPSGSLDVPLSLMP